MQRHSIILIHMSYWTFYLVLLLLVFFAAQVGLATPPIHASHFLGAGLGFVLLPSILGFYFFYSLLFVTYLSRRSLWILASYGLVSALGIALVCGGMIALLFDRSFMFSSGFISFLSEVALIGSISLINGIIGFILKGFISWYDDLSIKEELQQATHTMELELVKSKLDPHFLFNTINNIDGMMMTDVSVASKYLDKLSTILRFMLYESKADMIPLSKELEYINKYLDLQKIRTSNDEFIDFTITGTDYNHMIPAMIFIPFIENAFKHVDSKKQYHAIKINIDIEPENIHFQCCNNFNPNRRTSKTEGGVGNELIAKRLNLLYPERHQLNTVVNNESYAVDLTIRTNEN